MQHNNNKNKRYNVPSFIGASGEKNKFNFYPVFLWRSYPEMHFWLIGK